LRKLQALIMSNRLKITGNQINLINLSLIYFNKMSFLFNIVLTKKFRCWDLLVVHKE